MDEEIAVTRSVEIPEEAVRQARSAAARYGALVPTEAMRLALAAALPYLAPAGESATCDHSDYITDDQAQARCGSCGRLMSDLALTPTPAVPQPAGEQIGRMLSELADLWHVDPTVLEASRELALQILGGGE